MVTIDPVKEGIKYREMLLDLLGDRDPVEVARETPDRLRSIIAEAGDVLRARPEPKEWSVLELAAHLLHAEIVCTARYRWTIAHDEPELIGYDQDLWVDRLRANEDEPSEILALFDALRRANITLWQQSSDAEKKRVARHSERGPESFEQLFTMMAGHDLFHFDQIQKTIEALRR
jgi:DinB family protein